MTNDCKTCPVSTGTHKPAEAVHQIAEPAAPVVKPIKDAIDALVMAAFTEGGCSEHRMSEARIQTELRKKELRTLIAATQPAAQGMDAQALKQSFREYLSVSEHIDAGGHAMDSIATDLTRIVLTEEEVSAVIARRVHCNTSGQAGEDAANIRAAALAAQAKQGG